MNVLWRLSAYSWRHKWILAGAYAAMSGATLSMLVIPWLLGTAIDEALASGLRSQLFLLAGAILLVSLLRGIFSYGEAYLAESISQRAAYDVRNDFFQKLQSLSFGFHDRQQTGDLMSRATADVEAVRWYMSMGLVRGLSLVMLLAGVSALLLTTNWRLGLISLAFVPPVIWRAVFMARVLRQVWTQVQAETGHMTTVLQEALAGMRVVKAFAVAQHTDSATRLFASQGSIMTFIFTIATAAILWYGGREIAADRLTEGQLAAFILYMGILAGPIRMTGWLVNTFSRAISAGQRIFEVLDADSPVTEKPGATVMPRAPGHVQFEAVSLSYDSEIPAIHHIDLEVQPGKW